MTAEIAILNKSAVALAADSAVSIGPNAEKIYATNKLFALSKCHPCGVMVYGNAEFMGIPVETIVKLHREDIAATPEATLKGYADGLFSCLNEQRFAHADAEKAHIYSALDRAFEKISRTAEKKIRDEVVAKKGAFSKRAVRALMDEVLDSRLAKLTNLKLADSLAGVPAKLVSSRYKDQIEAAKNANFPPFALSKNSSKKVAKLAVEYLVRNIFSDYRSGIVVAGFGSTEMFPQLIEVEVDGVVAGKLKFRQQEHLIIDHATPGAIRPFAYKAMAHRFMEGVDPDYATYIASSIGGMLTKLIDEIVDASNAPTQVEKDATRADLEDRMGKRLAVFADEARAFRRERFVDPILDAVQILPKDELASMAEALVSLQSTKLRVSMEKEVVGGPIDVAIISKGDGLIWTKRKHYFPAELNQHFFRHYFQGLGGVDAVPR